MSHLSIGSRMRTVNIRFAILATAALLFTVSQASAQNLDVTPGSSTTFSFSGIQGGPFVAQTPNTWVVDDLDDLGLGFTVSVDTLWLDVLPTGSTIIGAGTQDVSAFINAAEANNLAPGNYSATITFTNITNGLGSTTREVSLSVLPASFTATPLFINLNAVQGGNSPSPVTVSLTNSGGADLNYSLTATSTNTNWYSISKPGGTVPGSGTDNFDLTFNTPGLAAGNYVLSIDAMNTTTGVKDAHIVVTLSVSAAAPGAVLTPNEDLSVVGAAGFLPGTIKTYTLTNTTTRNVTWSTGSSATWLSIEPSGGVLAPNDGGPGGLDEVSITVRVLAAANALAPGNFVGNVTFSDISTTPTSTLGTRAVFLTADPILSISPLATGGAIVLTPAGTPVPAAGSNKYEYPLNTVVTLQVSLDNLYRFERWVGDVVAGTEANNPVTVTMSANKSVGATVTKLLRTLNMSVNGTGTGTLQPAPTGAVVSSALVQSYVDGTTVSISAQADAGAIFTGWTGNVPDGHSSDNPLVLSMDRDRNLSASFQQIVDLNITTSGQGTVAVSPSLTTYYSGLPITITASPAAGFKFQGYSGDITSTTASLSLVLDSDKNIVATFVPNTTGTGDAGDGGTTKPPSSNNQTFSLSVQVTGAGTVTPNSGTFTDGATVELVATPDLGSVFVGWSGDASGSELATNVTFTKDLQVVATFAVDQSGGGGTPTASGGLCGAGLAGFLPLTMLYLAGARRKNRR